MGRRDVQAKLIDQTRETGGLAFGQIQHQPREGGRVDDRVLERALQPAPHEPGVERVVAVLDQDGAVRKAQEGAARVLEFRRSDKHRPIDMVAPARVRIDRSAAVDECVEERQRALERESLRPNLEDKKWRVARRLYVQCDELRLFQPRPRADLGSVDRDLFPRHELGRAARSALEKSHVESRPVRLIGVGLSGLEHPAPDLQLTLFD